MNIAEKLKKRAAELGLKDVDVARRAGIGIRRYGNYAEGTRNAPYDILLKICEALDTTPNYLLGYNDANRLNEVLFKNVLEACLKIYATPGHSATTEDLSNLIILTYKKYLVDEAKAKEPTDNKIIYAFLEGRFGNKQSTG